MMTSSLLLGAAMLLAFIGCGYFALSQEQHWRAVTSSTQPPSKQFQLKTYSALALIASYILFAQENGLGFALLLWPLTAGYCIFCIAMILAYRPAILRILVLAA
jgi:hypothetical protein